MASVMRQALTHDVIHGRMDTPEEEERLKRLYSQLNYIASEWSNFHPAPEFSITKDKHGQVHVKLNDRMLSYLLARFGELEDVGLDEVTPDEPPAWFMALMGGEPYEHLLPPEGAVLNPKRTDT